MAELWRHPRHRLPSLRALAVTRRRTFALASLDYLVIRLHSRLYRRPKDAARTAQRSARPPCPRRALCRFEKANTSFSRDEAASPPLCLRPYARLHCLNTMGDEKDEENGGRYEGIEDDASGGTSSLSTVAHRPAVPPLACMRYSPRPCVNQDIVDALKPLRDWRFAEYGCTHRSLSNLPLRTICSLCASFRQLEVPKASHTLLLSRSSSLARTRSVRAKRLAHSSRFVLAFASLELRDLLTPSVIQVGGKIALRIDEFLETGRVKEAGKPFASSPPSAASYASSRRRSRAELSVPSAQVPHDRPRCRAPHGEAAVRTRLSLGGGHAKKRQVGERVPISRRHTNTVRRPLAADSAHTVDHLLLVQHP